MERRPLDLTERVEETACPRWKGGGVTSVEWMSLAELKRMLDEA